MASLSLLLPEFARTWNNVLLYDNYNMCSEGNMLCKGWEGGKFSNNVSVCLLANFGLTCAFQCIHLLGCVCEAARYHSMGVQCV